MPRYRAIFTEPPIQFNRQDFSHNVLFAMPKPNIVGNFIAFSSGVGSFYETSENKGNTMPSTSPDTPRHNRIIFDASRSSALYKNDLAEIRVNALFGLNLIKAF